MSEPENIIYTVGHSTHSITSFVQMLTKHGIKTVVDVRRFPTSRKHPQFQQESLSRSLREADIAYRWLGDLLGGYRTGGYEAYTETEAFARGLEELERLGRQTPTAFMCAELLFFRCHRRFIADRLVARGWRVLHIMGQNKLYEHKGGYREQDNH